MRWVSYTRATSCIEEEIPSDIISRQNQTIADFMSEKGWTVEKKYSDRKKDKDEIGAFEQMVQDGIMRSFDGIVVSSVFRCGRDFSHAKEILMETFFPAGIHFAVAEDQFCSIGKAEKEISDYFKNSRAECLSRRMSDQVGRQIEGGKIPFQLRKYGYVFSEDRRSMKIEAEGASVVRYIFQQFLAGGSYSSIAGELNEKGVLPPQEQMAKVIGKQANVLTSARWHGKAVKRILSSSIYTGHTSCEVEGNEIVYDVPVIIREDVFEEAQKKIKKIGESQKGQKPRQTQGVSLLFKRIYDKNTGLPMCCVKNPLDKARRGYLPGEQRRCSLKMRRQFIPEEKVTGAIIHCLQTVGTQVQYIDQILSSPEGKFQSELAISPYRDAAKQIVRDMNQTCLARMETHYSFQAGKIDEENFQKMEEMYQEQFQKYEKEMQRIMADVKIMEKTYSSVNPWLVYYRDVQIPKELDHDFIKKWIDRVWIEDADHIEVVLKKTEWMNRLPKEWLQNGTEEM